MQMYLVCRCASPGEAAGSYKNTATAVDDEFLREFAEVVGDQWPSLASLLSFPTADVEQMKREVVGTPAEQALHMLRAWR